MPDSQYTPAYPVVEAQPQDRAAFIRRTYAHLLGAVLAFMGVEYLLLQSSLPESMLTFLSSGKFGWLLFMLLFMGASWLAQALANTESVGVQYFGLGLFVVAEALLFLPLIAMAESRAGGSVVPMAAAITWALFAGLTTVVFTTRKDFSFLGAILKVGGWVAIGLIAASIMFGFNMGLLFSGVMVVFAAGAILYDTSNILHRYGPHQHVAASLSLFASVMLLFWYVLRLLMGRRD
jgi:FtsH-binding integral membrane protein